MFENNVFVRMRFGVFGVFCIINCYFEYRIRILCIFCRPDHNLKILLNIFFSFIFLKMSQKCEQISYDFFFLCIYTGVFPLCPVVSRRRRRRPLSVRPSRRPSRRRRPSSVRPSSVRPSTSVHRHRPSSVRPSRRPSNHSVFWKINSKTFLGAQQI